MPSVHGIKSKPIGRNVERKLASNAPEVLKSVPLESRAIKTIEKTVFRSEKSITKRQLLSDASNQLEPSQLSSQWGCKHKRIHRQSAFYRNKLLTLSQNFIVKKIEIKI